jgi:hypothetical protein
MFKGPLMQASAKITLAVVIAMTGVPHAFCNCGCAGPAVKSQAQPNGPEACPHCRDRQREVPPDRGPRACECPQCDQIAGVVSDTIAVPPLPTLRSGLDIDPVSVSVPIPLALVPEHQGGAGPPGFAAGLGRSLPILLGHLLF